MPCRHPAQAVAGLNKSLDLGLVMSVPDEKAACWREVLVTSVLRRETHWKEVLVTSVPDEREAVGNVDLVLTGQR